MSVDWSKPIRFHDETEGLFYVGVMPNGDHIVCIKNAESLIDCYRVNADGFTESGIDFIENIPEKIVRWVIGVPSSTGSLFWFMSEQEAINTLDRLDKDYWVGPVRVEFEK